MKKLLVSIFMLISIVLLSSCLNNPKEKIDTTINRVIETNFYTKSNEYKELNDSRVDLFYNANESLPYIDIKEYMNMLDGVYYSNEFEYLYNNTKHTLEINYDVEYENEDLVNYSILFNLENNTLEVEKLEFFDYYIKSGDTNYGEGLVYLPSVLTPGNKVTFEFNKYNIELFILEDKYYIPLSIANLIFNQSVYFDVYFNGDDIYGIDTSDLDDKGIKEIMKSSKNREDITKDIVDATYNFMAFTLNYFYGLKSDRSVGDGYSFLDRNNIRFNETNLYKSVFDTVTNLDDLHSSHITRGYYNNRNLSTSYSYVEQGPNIKKFYDGMDSVVNEAADYFDVNWQGYIDIKDYKLIDNGTTIIIFLLGFDIDTPDLIEDLILSYPRVENIIIDLSLNTGGNLGAVLRTFTLMTNEPIKYHNVNPLDNSAATYAVKGEKLAYDDYNYFIKTSSVTFSAANLMASMAKELGIKVIGKPSSGGASSISFYVTPDGSIIILSSNMVLSTLNSKNEYESIENGITPDIILNKHYDEAEIINKIRIN